MMGHNISFRETYIYSIYGKLYLIYPFNPFLSGALTEEGISGVEEKATIKNLHNHLPYPAVNTK